MNNLYETAKKYRTIGWNILPLINYEKGMVPSWTKPTGYSWAEWQDKKPTNDEFEKLFSFKNITGVALITGKTSNIMMFDYDSYQKDAPKINFDSTLISKTASGGSHFYFQYEEMSEVRLQWCELKNATLDVLPPSEVINKQGVIGKYEWIKKDLKNLPKLPQQIKDLLKEAIKIKNKPFSYQEAEGLKIGSRDSTLLAMARSLLYKVSVEEMKVIIRGFNNGFQPPLNQVTVDKKISQALMYHQKENQPFIVNKLNLPNPISMKQAYDERVVEREKEKIAPRTGYFELDEAISGWTPGFTYILAGETGTGKTAIAANLAVRCSNQDKKVLYYSVETGNEIIDYLASVRLEKPYKDLTNEDLNYDDPNIKLYRTEIVTLKDLELSLEQNKDEFDLVIIDNIGFFEEKTSNPTQAQAELMKELSKLALNSKISIILIAHFNKQSFGKNIVSMDRISGSKAFSNYAKGIFLIKRNKATENPDDPEYAPNGLFIVAKSKRGASKAFPFVYNNNSALVKTQMDFQVGTVERQGLL